MFRVTPTRKQDTMAKKTRAKQPFVTLADGTTCPTSELITLAEGARIAGVSRQTLLAWENGEGQAKQRPLRTVKIGTTSFTSSRWLEEITNSSDPDADKRRIEQLSKELAKLKKKLG